jgi:hypothetical protein
MKTSFKNAVHDYVVYRIFFILGIENPPENIEIMPKHISLCERRNLKWRMVVQKLQHNLRVHRG